MNTVAETIYSNTLQSPDRVAVHFLSKNHADLPISYARLLSGAQVYARLFEQHGIQPGEVVILVLQHSEDLIYSFFGAILHGAIPSIMPFLTEKLSPERYAEDIAALLAITRPAVILTYPEFRATVEDALIPGATVRAVLVTRPFEADGTPSLDALQGLSRRPEDLVLLQHSSGTTGLQKGVALSNQAVLNQVAAYQASIHLREEDVVVSWLPLYHDMGLIAGFVLPILARVPLVLMSPFDWVRAPYRLMQAVTRYRGTLTWLPNFAYNFCAQKIREGDLAGVNLESWRAVINCSEPMKWESHQMFLQRFAPYGLRPGALATCYAMAENVFAVSQGGIEAPIQVDEIEALPFITQKVARPYSGDGEALKMLSAGRPLLNTQVRILNDTRHPLPDRQIGEIALQSSCMLTGYFNRPDETYKAFHDGWYLTGDLGYMVGGEVFVIGRKKDLIIVGGKNIYPQDLEALANTIPQVHPGRVVAFGVYDPQAGTEEVVLVAELDTEDPEEQDRIADEIRRRVTRGSAVALRYVQIVPPRWILKTSSGKTARAANRQKYIESLISKDFP